MFPLFKLNWLQKTVNHDIKRIAVVGDPRWQDQIQVFLFADYRQTEVRFFPETDLEPARAWLMN